MLAAHKSTSGLVIMLGSHPLLTSSTAQSILLSVGEGELYALIKVVQQPGWHAEHGGGLRCFVVLRCDTAFL